MKKTVLFLAAVLIGASGVAQTNSKGILQKNVLKLNNGITLSKGDTIMLGVPVNNGNEFVFVKKPKHAFGILGGDGANINYSYKMLIIKFFTASKHKESSEKKFVASLSFNSEGDVIFDCDIAEAIDNGEIIAKGRIPVRFNVAVLHDDLPKTEELPQKPATVEEKTIRPAIETTVEKTEEPTASNTTLLLNKVNALHKNGDINNNEHYQLLKIITGGSIEDKKGIVKTLQALRDTGKISISDYDKFIELFL